MRCRDCGALTRPQQEFCNKECLESFHAYEHPYPDDHCGECELCQEMMEGKEEDVA
jgi:hypothetical protein